MDVVFDEREEALAGRIHCVRVQYPPFYVLVSMSRTKVSAARWAKTRYSSGGTTGQNVCCPLRMGNVFLSPITASRFRRSNIDG